MVPPFHIFSIDPGHKHLAVAYTRINPDVPWPEGVEILHWELKDIRPKKMAIQNLYTFFESLPFLKEGPLDFVVSECQEPTNIDMKILNAAIEAYFSLRGRWRTEWPRPPFIKVGGNRKLKLCTAATGYDGACHYKKGMEYNARKKLSITQCQATFETRWRHTGINEKWRNFYFRHNIYTGADDLSDALFLGAVYAKQELTEKKRNKKKRKRKTTNNKRKNPFNASGRSRKRNKPNSGKTTT